METLARRPQQADEVHKGQWGGPGMVGLIWVDGLELFDDKYVPPEKNEQPHKSMNSQ